MRKLISLLIAVFLMTLCGVSARAEEIDYGRDELESALTDEAREILDSEGITPEAPAAFSFSEALGKLLELIRDKSTRPLRMLCGLCGVVLFLALSESVAAQGDLKTVLSAVGALCGAGAYLAYRLLEGKLNDILSLAFSVITGGLIYLTALWCISKAHGFTAVRQKDLNSTS